MSAKRNFSAVDDHTITVVKKTKGNGNQAIPPPTTTAPPLSERAQFCILTHDNYVSSGVHGVSTTYGTRTFPEVLKLYNERFNSSVTSTESVRKQCTAALRERYCSMHPEHPRNITYAARPSTAPKNTKSVEETATPAGAPLQLLESQKLADLQQLKAKLEQILEVAGDQEILSMAGHCLACVERSLVGVLADLKGNYGRMRVPAAVRNAADMKNYFTYGTGGETEVELEGDEEEVVSSGGEVESGGEETMTEESESDEE